MTTSFNAALVKLAGSEVIVLCVRERILDDPYESDLVRIAFEVRYHRPVVLVAPDARSQPRWRGRPLHLAALRHVQVDALHAALDEYLDELDRKHGPAPAAMVDRVGREMDRHFRKYNGRRRRT